MSNLRDRSARDLDPRRVTKKQKSQNDLNIDSLPEADLNLGKSMDNSRKELDLFPVILLVLIFFFNFYLIVKLSLIGEQINQIQKKTNDIQEQINDIQEQIDSIEKHIR